MGNGSASGHATKQESRARGRLQEAPRFPFECYRLIPGLPFGHPPENHLRDNMIKTLAEKDVGFEIRVQVQTDPFRMPIEARKTLPARTGRKPSFSRQKFDSPAGFESIISNTRLALPQRTSPARQSKPHASEIIFRTVKTAPKNELQAAYRAKGNERFE